ncbi:MAG: acyl carrier protein [Deltaproteobacteria bacterium]|nr:acyl carrier protein [Deltaproteobacteria bacterium]
MDVLNDILFPVVDEAQKIIDSAKGLGRTAESRLFGEGGLDSLGLVRFIVMVEERVEDQTGVQLTLASDKAMSRSASPFRTLKTLADYIEECLAEEGARG